MYTNNNNTANNRCVSSTFWWPIHRRWTLGAPSIVLERPRQAAYKPIANFPIATIEVAASATPIIAGASGPITPPATAPIVVLALRAHPIALVSPPPLGKRTPFPAACHATHQVAPRVHGLALPAAPQMSWKMLLRRL